MRAAGRAAAAGACNRVQHWRSSWGTDRCAVLTNRPSLPRPLSPPRFNAQMLYNVFLTSSAEAVSNAWTRAVGAPIRLPGLGLALA